MFSFGALGPHWSRTLPLLPVTREVPAQSPGTQSPLGSFPFTDSTACQALLLGTGDTATDKSDPEQGSQFPVPSH